MLRTLLPLAIVCTWLAPLCAEDPEPSPPEPKPFKGAIATVVVKPGQATTVTLSWDDGAGRLPVRFVSAERLAAWKMQQVYDDRLKCDKEGVTFELAADEMGPVSAIWETLGESSELHGKQKDGAFKHLTVDAFKVTAAADAKPGLRRFYFLQVSGTGRTMFIEGEVRVVVSK